MARLNELNSDVPSRNTLRWRAAAPAALLGTGINSLLGPIDTRLVPSLSLGLLFKYLSAPKLRVCKGCSQIYAMSRILVVFKPLPKSCLSHSSHLLILKPEGFLCACEHTHTLFKSFLKLLKLSPQGVPCSPRPVPDCVCLTSNTGSVFCTDLCSGRPSPWKACCCSGLLTLAYSSISAQS